MLEPEAGSGKSGCSPGAAQVADTGKVRGQEIEIKFRTDTAGLALLLNAPLIKTATNLQTEILKATYFDTPSNALRNKGIILRVRKSGDAVPALGTKAPGDGPFHRKEVEVNSPSLKPNIALFDKTTKRLLARIIRDQPIEQKFKMQFKRQSSRVKNGNSTIEIAADEGHISFGKQRVPLAEVELELVSGNEADLFDLAKTLAEVFPLRLDFVSKAEKGFRALLQEQAAAVKAEPIKPKSLATFDDTVKAIVSNTLAQFVANWACLRETNDPESIHQMRIALRRMRCGLAMFRRALPNTGFDNLRRDAGSLAAAFGPARNGDAFRISALQGPLASPDCPGNRETLLAMLEKRRNADYQSARSQIEGPVATLFVLKVQSFLALRSWRDVPAGEQQASLKKFSRAALDRLSARVLKRGRKIATVSDAARHKLRIALKNLRYGVEFFGPLHGNRGQRRAYKKTMSTLQDFLGIRNDIVVARSYAEQLRKEASPDAQQVLDFILGWNAREAAITDKAIGKSWKNFKRTDIFWK